MIGLNFTTYEVDLLKELAFILGPVFTHITCLINLILKVNAIWNEITSLFF